MWKELFSGVRGLFEVDSILTRHEREINELRHELRTVSASLEELRHEMKRFTENERHEREKFFLRVENALLDFEIRMSLPPARSQKRSKRR